MESCPVHRAPPEGFPLSGLEVRLTTPEERPLRDALMDRHHYLGFPRLAGHGPPRLATFRGVWPGLAVWRNGAFRCRPRERWIGWRPGRQFRRLEMVSRNTRFPVIAWPRALPDPGSRFLSPVTRRPGAGWLAAHGHRVPVTGAFRDPKLFSGAMYRTAGRERLGQRAPRRPARRTGGDPRQGSAARRPAPPRPGGGPAARRGAARGHARSPGTRTDVRGRVITPGAPRATRKTAGPGTERCGADHVLTVRGNASGTPGIPGTIDRERDADGSLPEGPARARGRLERRSIGVMTPPKGLASHPGVRRTARVTRYHGPLGKAARAAGKGRKDGKDHTGTVYLNSVAPAVVFADRRGAGSPAGTRRRLQSGRGQAIKALTRP